MLKVKEDYINTLNVFKIRNKKARTTSLVSLSYVSKTACGIFSKLTIKELRVL